MEDLTLEKEFRFYADFHKVSILRSYFESIYFNVTKDDAMANVLAQAQVNQLAENPELIELAYKKAWKEVAELLP